MQILLNGSPYETDANTPLDRLIARLDTEMAMPQRFAIEVNAELVPRSTYADYLLQPDDQVEIVQAIGGG